jgi:hypothetical protein
VNYAKKTIIKFVLNLKTKQICFQIGIVLVMTLTESRGYLLDGTYSHDCLSPATCQGCADNWGGVYITFSYTIFKCSYVGLTVFPTIHGNRSISGGLSTALRQYQQTLFKMYTSVLDKMFL